MEKTLPSFDTIERALLCLKALGVAAETHGLLCALLSSGAKMRKQAWVNSLLTNIAEPGDIMAKDAVLAIERMFEVTQAHFSDDNCQLQLLLPADDAPAQERIEALTQWCQGYMSGLKLVGVTLEGHQNAEVQEALDDIMQIACMDTADDSAKDPNVESHLIEIVEFIRVAVMLVQDDCLTQQAQQPQYSQEVH